MEPGSRAKAIYDFQGTEPSELTLRAGDVVDIVERIDENWLVGTLDGKTGSFPSSYVTSVLQKKVIAKETFPASTDGDLAFQKGDIITLLDKIDDNWWRGQLGDKIGIFPFNYVEEYNASNNQESQTAGGDAQKARALQDLTGQLHDELSFKKNDVITITEKVDGDWYRGTLNGQNGLVPSFCVEMLASDTSQSSLGTDQSQKVDYSKLNDNLRQSLRGTTEADTKTAKSTSESSEPWAKSMYPFSADNPGELSFMDGEKIILTRRIDEQWLEGRIDGRVGVFPCNYVNIVVDLPPQEFAASTNMTTRTNTQSNGPEKCKGTQGKAMFDFNADTAQDLPLKAGEVITIIVKVDADWYEARNASGQVGYCPVNYVELLQSKPKKRPAPKPPSKKSPTKVTSFPTATSTEQSVTIFSGSITSAGENHSQEPASLQAGQPLNTATDLTTSLPSTEQKNIFGEGDTAFTAGPATDNSSIGLCNFQAGDSVQNQDPLLPSMYKQGGSSYKSVSFAPKGVSTSSSGDSGKGDMLHRQDAVTQQSPPAIDLSMFDSMAPVKPTTNSESAAPSVPKTLLDASPVVESGGDILAPSKPADSTSKPVDNSSFAFDPLLAPTPFISGGHKEIKSVHRPVSSGSQSAAPSLTSDFDPFAAESTIQQPTSQAPPLVPTSAPVAKPTLETKLRSISQMSHDLDEFFGTADSYTSRVSTLDSIDNVLDPLGSSVAVDSQPFVPFTEVSPQPPPLPPRQPSPNPFAASVEQQQQQQQQQLQSAIMSPSSTASTGSSRQSSLEVTPGWQSKNYSIDSMASEFSDDAGYYHGLTFSIKPLGDSPPVAGGTAFKLPPPPSSPRRPKRLNSEERPQSPKFDPKTAVPRPKPRKSIDSTSSSGSGILQLSTPPPGHPRTQPQPDNRAKVSEALESFEWNVAITQRSETVSQSSDSAVDDLLGLGDPFDDSQPLSTATVADSAVKPSRPAPPAPQKVELRVPPVKSEKPLSPSRTINIDVTLTFENEDFFSTGKAPPVARPPPPKKVPPRPAPPKTRPQTIVEDEILGPLRPGGRTMDQNEEYIALLETRINQLDVEIYAIKESKVKFEEMLKVVSDENREDITGQLQECIAEIDKLTEEQSWVKGELKDLRPDPVGDLKKRNAQMRTKVVDELMQTERDYVKDIKLCYEGFIGSLKGQKFQTLLVRAKALQQEEDSKNKQNRSSMKGLELDILFGNVEQVIDVSERFLESLEENITRKPPEEQLAGLCFINFSKELEEVYSQYCRNHDDAIALLEKYEDNPDIQEYINDGLAIVRQSTNCWDLASFLIKPVQRILKYPLLLNELIKVTEEDHADKSNLLKAINTMTDVATAINEFKRRKDLVLKYRKSDSDTISNKLGKLNLHSIRKKSQRMNQRFSQVTGLVTQTIDEEFVEEERKFRDLEKTIKIFVKDVNSYLEKLQEATSEQAVLAEDIADYYANQSNLDEVAKYSKSQRDLANKLYKNYTLFVQQRVVSPLNQLLIMFQGPHKLIQKRFDKLLDYDSVLHKGEKGKSEKTKSKHKEKELDEEKDCDSPKITKYQGIREKDKEKQSKETKDERTLALKNYEALNKQLLDEMPKLYSMSVTLLKECVQSFIEAERDHFDATLKHLYPLLKLPMILDSSREDILNDFTTRNQQAIEKFLSFSFVPRNFDKKSGEKKSIKKVPSPTKQMPTQSTSQGDGQKSYVLSRYLTDQLYRVTLDYTARDSMDISVKKGDLVGVIKRQDPMGGNDKWYVDNGASQGFVPSSIMEACGDEMKDAPIASISDLSSSSHSQPDYVSEADSSSFSQQFQPEQQEPVCQYYYAEWAFEATGPNEVSLGEGEAVRVVTMNDLEGNPEWWLVEKNGQQGYVPANYLARIE